ERSLFLGRHTSVRAGPATRGVDDLFARLQQGFHFREFPLALEEPPLEFREDTFAFGQPLLECAQRTLEFSNLVRLHRRPGKWRARRGNQLVNLLERVSGRRGKLVGSHRRPPTGKAQRRARERESRLAFG